MTSVYGHEVTDTTLPGKATKLQFELNRLKSAKIQERRNDMLKPLGDRVVLKIEEKEQTVGGFVLAGSAQEKTKTAKVVAIGQGSHLEW